MARRLRDISTEDLASLQKLCEFDLSAKRLKRVRFLLSGHVLTFDRDYKINMLNTDMGIRYRLDETGGQVDIHMLATGHPRAPLHMEIGGSAGPQGLGQYTWFRRVAERYLDCERIIAAGYDPLCPPPEITLADPCLVRSAHIAGLTPQELLDLMPRVGEIVFGKGWRANSVARTVDAGSFQAHVERDVGRVRLIKLGLGSRGSYTPPDFKNRNRIGIITVLRTQLPDTLKAGMPGRRLEELMEAPELDPGMTIKSFGKSGASLLVRVEGCEMPRSMK